MSDIYELLNLHKEILENFALQGRLIEKDIQLERTLRNASRTLKAIEDRFQDDGHRPVFDTKSIEEVIAKLKNSSHADVKAWTIRELRIVSYHMTRFDNDGRAFESAVSLLESQWKDLYINGLMFFLMNSWNSCSETHRTSVAELIKRHLLKYTGHIKRYLIIKEQTDLIEAAGPRRMAAILAARKLPLIDAPTLLGYKASALSLPYFSDVIINYFNRQPAVDFWEMEELFKKHSYDRTKKLIYARLVEQAEDRSDASLQDAVTRSARRVLGDINIATTWSPFTGATADEKSQLEKARALINLWGTRKTVEAFFDVCVQDSRRRKFWMDYIGHITDYRIAGSTTVKTKLQSHSEVAPLLKGHFYETNSTKATTAALILFIRDKIFVEFSDTGALYIYNSTNAHVKNIKKIRYIGKIEDLKQTAIGSAVVKGESWSYSYQDEGKINHTGEWEDRANRWMCQKMGLQPGQKAESSTPRPKPNPPVIPNTPNPPVSSTASTPKQIVIQPIQVQHKKESIGSNTIRQSLFTEEELNRSNPTQSQRTVLPARGSRVTKEIKGIHSKWIFEDPCRILIDRDGIYVNVRRKNRTYFVAPHEESKIDKCAIWLISSTSQKYIVQLAFKNTTNTQVLGTIEQVGADIVFTSLNGNKVRIQIPKL